MARLTVEDCLKNVDNRYDLVILASKRSRQLEKGVDPRIDPEGHKPTVIALREVAEGEINADNIEKINSVDTESEAADANFNLP